MARRSGSAASVPCVLAISGWDPSGGAGAAADLRAFAEAGAWGCAALTVVTAQSTAGLREAYPVSAAQLQAQIRCILEDQNIRAIKLGALGSVENVRAVHRAISPPCLRGVPLVVDPVVGATRSRRGATLLDRGGVEILRLLASKATVLTPNALEAEALCGRRVRTLEQAEAAARELAHGGARAVLIKGGHLAMAEAIDVLAIGTRVVHFSAPRYRIRAHGTGCRLASLVAAKLATHSAPLTDKAIIQAVRWAKKRLTDSLLSPVRVGRGMLVLGPGVRRS